MGTVARLRIDALALCAIACVSTISASSSISAPLSIIATKRTRFGFDLEKMFMVSADTLATLRGLYHNIMVYLVIYRHITLLTYRGI